MRFSLLPFLAAGAVAHHNHHQLQHQHQYAERGLDLAARQDIQDDPLGTCPSVTPATVELTPITYSYFFPSNTVVDAFLNGILITITNAPIEITFSGFLTITRGAPKTTPTSPTTTAGPRPTSAPPSPPRTTSNVPQTSRQTSSAGSASINPTLTGPTTLTTTRASSAATSPVSSRVSSASGSSSRSASSGLSSTTATSVLQSSTASSTVSTVSSTPSAPPNGTYFVASTILIIVRNAVDGASASSGLNGYGIPFELLYVPSTGAPLPTLNTTFGGNYGGIIVAGQVSYQYGTAFQSALTPAQWQQLYDYQTQYGVRMVQYDVFPGPLFGASLVGTTGCCAAGVEQNMYFTQTTPQSGLRINADFSTLGLYHYPASIADATTTTEIARFRAAGSSPEGVAAVINNFAGREQMVFFISWATDFSATSNFLQHEYITWMTRGLYSGYRRVYLNTQIDDMFLSTTLYQPANIDYRVVPADMQDIWNWVPTIQAKMNAGSFYLPEIGHNGNGNIEYSTFVAGGDAVCAPGPIEYNSPPDTPLEFKKPLGTGTNLWPTSPTVYGYSTACNTLDPLFNWFRTPANQNRFIHISHTFTHLELNNATYSDALKEIQFNQAWLQQIGFTAGRFTPNGLIPPAITGLHNGDVLRAWTNAGLRNCVGDNTRPALRNQQNNMYPYTTSLANDNFDGYIVLPRWATRIYYNCDKPACTTQEWINTSAGKGDFYDLLNVEKSDTMRHLFGLFHEGYMFHQANLRTQGVDPITINGVTSTISIFQAWVETVVQEFTRLVNWPSITLQQSDLAVTFTDRQTRDACQPRLTWNKVGQTITSATVTANGNSCSVRVPVTIPNGITTDAQGFQTEQIGNDPLTIWVQLTGSPVTFQFTPPIAVP
ncbi:uncharacterized protein HMPREF1541_08046 [Cyphellophora europaea CBS 101466]|uniref:Extracellular serine-rich protein n=1 Tax=Cyphellophora europaea (strain CBS 101466) TaxID=1220924 RepID=W2RKP6_CYPE1|nr:uncharacterized protein HMPREF1541_08046 [Cyphellophora europaea CBS 101466]ETN37056.1 hypothetical protein HMPREF1541_08046 [Cyphellophora europaea CBS 101466]